MQVLSHLARPPCFSFIEAGRGFAWCLPDVVIGMYWEENSESEYGNLPGWRWATITKVALDRLSRSLHSDVCDSDGLRDAAIHSTISGSGGRRDSAASNNI